MSPHSVHSDMGNIVLAATQHRPQIHEGGGAEQLDVDDLTVLLVWVSDRDNIQSGWKEKNVSLLEGIVYFGHS